MPTQRMRSGRIQEEVFSSSSSDFDDAPSGQAVAGRRQHPDNRPGEEEEEENGEEHEGWYGEEEDDYSPSSQRSGEQPDLGYRQRQAQPEQLSGSKHQIELAYHALQVRHRPTRLQ